MRPALNAELERIHGFDDCIWEGKAYAIGNWTLKDQAVGRWGYLHAVYYHVFIGQL